MSLSVSSSTFVVPISVTLRIDACVILSIGSFGGCDTIHRRKLCGSLEFGLCRSRHAC